jgi:hypothetical protein
MESLIDAGLGNRAGASKHHWVSRRLSRKERRVRIVKEVAVRDKGEAWMTGETGEGRKEDV